MNTNPNAITVLCFGDSNIYGTRPDNGERWLANVRWTGVLQDNLGQDYYIIEEGLGGRNTDFEHYDQRKKGRNGLDYFYGCLESHMPLDLIIIMLGTNDLKTRYGKSVKGIASSLEKYIEYVSEFVKNKPLFKMPKVILISPPYLNSNAKNFTTGDPRVDVYSEGSAEKSRELGSEINELIDKHKIGYLNAGVISSVGDDGIHLDSESHKVLGDSVTSLVKEIFHDKF